MTLRDRLEALFSPTRRLAAPESDLLHQGGLLGPEELVVPRALCRYRRFDFSEVARTQRGAAAALAVRRAYPHDSARHYLAWTGAIAHAWIWSDAVSSAAESEQVWLPESVLLPTLPGDGERLLQLTQGYEGQVWRNGQLAGSRWWPQVPAAHAWRSFLRACSIDVGSVVETPVVELLGWQRRPWGMGGRAIPWSPATLERAAWVGAGAVLGLALGWQLAGLAVWSIADTRLDGRLADLREQATPLLEARERAMADMASLSDYRSLQDAQGDYLLMTEVIGALPADAVLAGWRREATRLQAIVKTAETDPRVLVSAFQRHPVLNSVTATPTNSTEMTQLDFELKTLSGRKGEP